jgi:hypothetical protein
VQGDAKLKEQTQGYCRSQKKLAAAGRKVTHHAAVALCKIHVVRKNQNRDKVSRKAQKG